MNGDVLTTIDYKQLFALHIEKGAKATVTSKIRESIIDFGVLKLDKQGFLQDYIEKPVYSFSVSMGVYILSKDCLNLIHDGESIGMPELLMRLKDAGEKVYCHESDCYWLDIGRVDDYEKAQEEFEAIKHELLRDNGK
jgi:NDP-sugar pyrophosphorylase family protein